MHRPFFGCTDFMTNLSRHTRSFVLLAFLLTAGSAEQLLADQVLTKNADFETDQDGDNWPDGWPQVKPGGSWVKEDGNHFLRLSSPSPGETVMLYQEIPIPIGAEAIELVWKQRISGLQLGQQSWFDARIMMEFLNANRAKITPSPRAPSSRQDTNGWVSKSSAFLVPAGATTLKFMPCLLQVTAGTFDLDDVVLRVVDATPIRHAAEITASQRRVKLENDAEKRRAKAGRLLTANGSLITNGNFETDSKSAGWPDHWGRLKIGGSWEQEGDNHFLRLRSPAPGTMVMAYRTFDLPADTKALELRWRQRVTGLKKGDSPWFDARIMMEFSGIDGKKLKSTPAAPFSQRDTAGWIERSTQFLVPEAALTLVMMPSLFQAQSGTFDIDDLVLRPIEPEPLLMAAKRREAEVRARYVPPEEPDQTRWPSELRVVGNRLHDVTGTEVWLQGVNAGGLETLPGDRQVIKSVVVAVDEWQANCVRVPMNETFWFGKSAYQRDGGQEYREIISQIITLAANRGAYVVIDLHRFRAPKSEHADFWKEFAALYKNHPAVLFDIFNEPHGVTWEQWRNGGWVGEKTGVDESAFLASEEQRKNEGFESIGMQKLVDAVRSTGAKNIIVAGGIFWCNDLSGITRGYALNDSTGNGIMYSWHTYNWHTNWQEKVLATAAEHPIFLGEVGADIKKLDFIPAADQEDPYTWVPDMLGFIQQHRLNWTGWCLHPKASPVMISDWSYTPTPFWGEFAKQALKGRKFPLNKTR